MGRLTRWTDRRPTVLFAVTMVLFLAALAIRIYIAAILPGYEDDTTHFKWWTRLVTQDGLSQAYSGTYPQTYAIYPPLMLGFLDIVGHLYQWLFSSSFALDGPQLGFMIKGLGIFFDVLIWVAIYFWVRKRNGQRAAVLCALAYAFSPAIIFDVSYWGEPDPIHSFFLLISVLLLADRKPALGWASLAAAAFVKPQVWVFLPLAGILTLWRSGLKGLASGAGAAVLVVLVMVSPYVRHGTLADLMTLPQAIYEAMPVLSANAHNIWWLYNSEPALVPDDGRVWLVSQRALSLMLLGIFYCYALWRLRGRADQTALLGIAAFLGFSFFMLPTRVHENHMFMVLPLLAVAMAGDARLRWVFGVLSVTFLANLALHDPPLASILWKVSAQPYWQPLQLANSAVNVLVLLGWAVMLGARRERGVERPGVPEPASLA